jgi:hypothetical protein
MSNTITKRQRVWTSASHLRRWLGMVAGCAGLLASGNLAPSGNAALAQAGGYRSSKDAPPSWKDFALKLRARLQERLTDDDDATLRLRRFVEARGMAQASDQTVVAKVWVTSTGSIERIELDGIDQEIAVALRDVLARARVEIAPPPDMLQPLHLRLLLREAG